MCVEVDSDKIKSLKNCRGRVIEVAVRKGTNCRCQLHFFCICIDQQPQLLYVKCNFTAKNFFCRCRQPSIPLFNGVFAAVSPSLFAIVVTFVYSNDYNRERTEKIKKKLLETSFHS